MDKTRRTVLKGMCGLAAAVGLPLQFLPRPATAQAHLLPPRLVVIQLKGGNDGVNTVIPIDDTQYAHYTARRSEIALPREPASPGDPFIQPFGDTTLEGSPNTGVQLGLHPALSALLPLKEKLAIFPATHTGSNSDTSHFFQFDYVDGGYFVGASSVPDNAGWAGRFLQSQFPGTPDGIVAFDFATGRKLFRGGPAISLGDPANLGLGTGTQQGVADAIWADVKATSEKHLSAGADVYAASQRQLFDNALKSLNSQNVDFNREPKATYPVTKAKRPTPIRLGVQLRRTVDMFIGLPELKMVHMELGGFDTHNAQIGVRGDTGNVLIGKHADLLQQLGDSLAAFYFDLQAELLGNVIVVVMSEFGRTVDANGNRGTDHGQAAPWFVLGEPVIGDIYGDYPGLAETQLDRSTGVGNNGGRFWLRQTVDYRDILSELLGPKFLGGSIANAQAAFPGYAAPAENPLKFIA